MSSLNWQFKLKIKPPNSCYTLWCFFMLRFFFLFFRLFVCFFLGGQGALSLTDSSIVFLPLCNESFDGKKKTPYDKQNPLFRVLHEVKYLSTLRFPNQRRQSELFADPLLAFCLFVYVSQFFYATNRWVKRSSL